MAQPRRILVVTSGALFVKGGHLTIANETAAALRRAGYLAEVLVTPQNRFGRQLPAYLATRLTDVGETADGHPVDQVISLRFPSYAVRHPRHVCWLNHRMREYYDLWDQFSSHLSWKGRIKERTRRAIVHRVDKYLFERMQRRFVISGTVQARLRRFGGIQSDVLYPPPPKRDYRHDTYGDYLFGVSRLSPLKRFDLVLRALAEPIAAGIKCVIAGEGAELDRLMKLSSHLELDHRVQFAGRLDEEGLIHHLARCRAVVFAPWNEDYGFVTVEAFMCGKPVITCHDSGGPSELVRDGENGFVTAPTPEALAVAMRRMIDDRNAVARMGQEGQRLATAMSWHDAIQKLLLPVR